MLDKSKNIELGLSKKAVKQLESNEPLNINNIDSMSYNDLKKLRDNLERFNDFGFDESSREKEDTDTVKTAPLVLGKRYKQRKKSEQ